MKGFIKRGFACISAMAILFTCVEVPMSTQATETDSVDSTETSERDYSLEGVDLWGTEIIQSSIDNKIEDIMIEDFKAEDYDEFYASLVELIRYYLVSWQNGYVYITLLMTPEEHEKLTGLGDDIKSTEGMNYWTQIIGNARVAATDSIEEMDEAYWNYFEPHTSYTVSSSWMSTSSSNNEYAEQGYIKIKVGFKAYRGSSPAEELEARQTVIQMFSDGGELAGYGKDNDLKTDFEKATAVWYWIRDNVSYSGGIDKSSYSLIVKKSTVCGGYATGSVLLLHYAGVDARYIDGRVKYGSGYAGHAWNWIKIGEEWYAWDSTWNAYTLWYLNGINGDVYQANYKTSTEYENIVSPLSTEKYNYIYTNKTRTYTQNEATDSGSIGSNLKWTLQDGVLKISGTGEMRDFDSADEVPWKNFLDKITKLEIGEGVTSIGANAFAKVTGLTYENCKDSLTNITRIGANAFSDQSEEVVNLTAQKSEASSKIDAMEYLEEADKRSYKEQINEATTEEEINKVVTEAQEKNAELQVKAELEVAKKEAKETLNSCAYLSEENRTKYEAEIEEATDESTINSVLEKAKKENEELKAEADILIQKKTEGKNTIEELTYLSETEKQTYVTKIEEASTAEEIETVIKEAEAENDKQKAEAELNAVTAKGYTGTYDGKSHTITLSNVPTGSTIQYRTSTTGSWTTTKPTRTNVGTTTVYYQVTDTAGNTVTGSATITINKASASVSATGYSGTYDGKSHTITLSNVPSGSTIKYRTSTTGSWTTTKPTRTSAGTTTVYYQITNENYETITGSTTIKVTKAKASATAKAYSGTYDGKSHTITLSNVPSGSTINYRTSTTGSWTTTKPTRTSAGTTTVYYQITNANYETITGSAKITVNKKNTSKLTVSSISNQTYTGKQIKPSVTVKNGSTKLKSGTDYTVSYGTNKNTGQGYVKITGKGNYTGTVTKYFNIVPKAPSVSLKAGSKSFTVTSKSTGASGYEIAYSTKKSSGYKTVTGSSSKKISGLKAKTTYYVKVRAYKTINGKKVYGSYSSVKTIKTK